MSASAPFPPGVRDALVDWFRQYGANDLFEIEMRVQEVGGGGFDRLLTSLLSNKAWSNTAQAITLDVMHATGVRETREMMQGAAPKPPTFMRKQKGNDIKVPTGSGYDVRFQVSSETETSADASPAHLYRHKQRYTFVHKRLFKFELTRVKQGPTLEAANSAETTFEVEIEFCGQSQAEAQAKGPEYLADSLMMKAADVLAKLVSGGDGGKAGKALGRRRDPSAPLGECDEVDVAEGTEVVLEPSGHAMAPRFNGEMPAQLCQWLYSHAEPDGRVVVMSEPAAIGNDRFPLFYFVGSVPAKAVSHRRG